MARSLGMAVLGFGLLAGGTLTGKFNQAGAAGDTRMRTANDQQKQAAETVLQIANEIGRTPSQVAINWARQKNPDLITILGARSAEQIKDNLGVLDFGLSTEQMERLSAIKPLDDEFPGSFWNDFVRRSLVFGERVDALALPSDRPQ